MRISDWSSDVCSSDLSLTSYNDFQRKALSDWSGAPYEILLQKADGRIKSFAQEIHFEGEAGAVNWLVGGYYGHDKIVDRNRTLLGDRSEEHTSELPYLMSISYTVFCSKKKHTPDTNN